MQMMKKTFTLQGWKWCCLCMHYWSTVICRVHSFPQQIWPNSMGQFAKFCGSPWQNCPNTAAYRGLLFVHKLSFILF